MMAVIQDALTLVNSGNAERAETAENADSSGCVEQPVTHAGQADEEKVSATSASSASTYARERVDLAHLPQDPAVYRMLCAADTIGVFQVESRAQMATLPRLKPTTFYDIVVQVAIIRPGPIVGQMVHPYLNRRAGREPVTYPHPSLEPILARTLGVPLFQEQLLRIAMVAAGFTGGQAEELRRAFGFKRSERRMRQVEVQLREGMAHNGITGEAAEQIITSITSFALYGFPESHAASFALLAYASAYLKMQYPAAFYTALLNNQPMGFYHPATLVKDAQRRGVRFQPIDVQISEWNCTVEPDGAIRLGLRYVSGLREAAGKAIAARPASGSGLEASGRVICPKCGCDDPSMIEVPEARGVKPEVFFCNSCSHDWVVRSAGRLKPAPTGGGSTGRRWASLDEVVSGTALRRDELVTLADIGALNSFGYDRRSALWQAERAVRPAGELFAGHAEHAEIAEHAAIAEIAETEYGEISLDPSSAVSAPSAGSAVSAASAPCPLKPMTEAERIVADYAGTSLTIGRHPMALRRDELAMRGIMRAIDLHSVRQGRRVRVAGMVITRQRPGTAKGFVFLTLEDETGIANIIVRPDLFARDRLVVIEEPFLVIDGVLQNQDGVTAVRAEVIRGLKGVDVDFNAHDFY
jgi:error-prone DNA polymerase